MDRATNDRSPPLAGALERLYRRNLHTMRLGLETVEALLEDLGRPQDAFLSVHVAGTNGKGSVCAMLESVLRAAGYRTGLYTSPHLIRFHERVCVGGEPIADRELAGLLEDLDRRALRLAEKPGARDVTFFELATALAFEHFRHSGVQVAVVETGMGGRLDATNVVLPAAAVITPIGLDHMEHLGRTLAVIAAEKAGIIKAGRPVVGGDLAEEAREVVERIARERGADLRWAADGVSVSAGRPDWEGQKISIETASRRHPPIRLPLVGEHQVRNAALAVAALETLADAVGLPVPDAAVRAGLEAVHWPARFQVLGREPPTVLDGAHNPQAARALVRTLKAVGGGRPVALVAGFLGDKDAEGFLREFAGLAREVRLVELTGERAMPRVRMEAAAAAAGLGATAQPLDQALAEAEGWARASGGIVCIAGSLYLAGAVLAARSDRR